MSTALRTAPTCRTPLVVDRPGDSTTVDGLPGHFCLLYQPQLDLHSGAIDRCEALLRWWHPEFGLLRPRPALVGTRWHGAVARLDEWALGQACHQGAIWADDGLDVEMAVDLGASFLLGRSFPRALDRTLGDSGITPRRLAVDVPFDLLAVHPLAVHQLVRDLADAGVEIIVDGVVGDARPPMIDRIDAGTWKIELGRTPPRATELHPSAGRALRHAHMAGARAVATSVGGDDQLVALRSSGFDGIVGSVVSPALLPEQARRAFRPAAPLRRPLFG